MEKLITAFWRERWFAFAGYNIGFIVVFVALSIIYGPVQ